MPESEQDQRKEYADQHCVASPKQQVGDKVLVTSTAISSAVSNVSAKFIPRRDGPYVICTIVSPTTYEIAATGEPNVPIGKFHASMLTPYQSTIAEDPAPIRPKRKRGRPKKQVASSTATTPQDPGPAGPVRRTTRATSSLGQQGASDKEATQ